MWWIAIPAAIAAAIVAVLLLPVKFRLTAGDEIHAEWRVLFYKRTLYPAPEKKKKKKKGAKKETEKKKAPEKKRQVTAESAITAIKAVKDALAELWDKLRRRMKIKLIQLRLIIATDEAAKTAVIYGAAANACDTLLDVLRRYMKYTEKDGAVCVSADFTKEKTEFDLDVEFSLTVFGAIAVLLPTLNKYLSENKNK